LSSAATHLNNTLYTRFRYSVPLRFAMLQGPECCCNGIQCAGQRSAGYSCGRKRDIFYSRTLTWKGTFIFADRRVVAISTVFKTLSREYQCHVREHGSRTRSSRRLTIWISLVSSKNSSLSSFALRSSSFFRIPLLIVLHAIQQVTLNWTRNSRLTANLFLWVLSHCDAILICLSPFVSAFYLRRDEYSRDVSGATFNFKSIYYFTTLMNNEKF